LECIKDVAIGNLINMDMSSECLPNIEACMFVKWCLVDLRLCLFNVTCDSVAHMVIFVTSDGFRPNKNYRNCNLELQSHSTATNRTVYRLRLAAIWIVSRNIFLQVSIIIYLCIFIFSSFNGINVYSSYGQFPSLAVSVVFFISSWIW
jgi:hypothetical protein